ncbi:MetQ/NlpA family ABC transporter substrate-binding protein [Irregularibacter muris]|uniref:MetQ/NlpA family ABC transporter substrate-binding protein n=1 Tax=Irregularibacter muris TaxID=1796619 RepID=A0AAE3HFK1_9FIRM|nr:MetQ/NlpA family ABC transporter substrate-binding protein [Irregularibacter muris]MCR1898565.1 MetQ/NlpA family ABC transporter substrate-binding protein [Irregularibacter muris]
MKTIKKSFILLMSLVLLLGIITGCGQKTETTADKDQATKKEITVGVSQGPYNVLFDEAVKPILEKQGYTVKSVEFQDLLQSEIALNNNEIDFNVAQHTAYAENFNEAHDGRLVAITPIPTVPAGIFSATNTSVDQIEEGDKIAIPNDASNAARAYALLQKAGWISLKEDVELLTASVDDVIENPYNLEFVEMESLNIPRALQDFDFAVITGSIVYNAKIDTSTVLLQEDILKHLELVVVVNEEDKDTQWAKDIVEAYHSDEFKKYMEENNSDNFWYVPDELK